MTKNGKWKFLNINYNHLDISVKDRGTNYEQLYMYTYLQLQPLEHLNYNNLFNITIFFY